jgi:hypothetical protein
MPTITFNESPVYIKDQRQIFVCKKEGKLIINTVVEEIYDHPEAPGQATWPILNVLPIMEVSETDPLYPLTQMLYLNQQALLNQLKKYEPIRSLKPTEIYD